MLDRHHVSPQTADLLILLTVYSAAGSDDIRKAFKLIEGSGQLRERVKQQTFGGGVEAHPVVPGLLGPEGPDLQPQLALHHPAQPGEVACAHLQASPHLLPLGTSPLIGIGCMCELARLAQACENQCSFLFLEHLHDVVLETRDAHNKQYVLFHMSV